MIGKVARKFSQKCEVRIHEKTMSLLISYIISSSILDSLAKLVGGFNPFEKY